MQKDVILTPEGLEKLKQDYFSRWDLIIDLDTEKHLADAVVMYDEIR